MPRSVPQPIISPLFSRHLAINKFKRQLSPCRRSPPFRRFVTSQTSFYENSRRIASIPIRDDERIDRSTPRGRVYALLVIFVRERRRRLLFFFHLYIRAVFFLFRFVPPDIRAAAVRAEPRSILYRPRLLKAASCGSRGRILVDTESSNNFYTASRAITRNFGSRKGGLGKRKKRKKNSIRSRHNLPPP